MAAAPEHPQQTQQQQQPKDAFVKISMKSPYNDTMSYIPIPNVHCKDLEMVYHLTVMALAVVNQKKSFAEYPLDEIGIAGIRCLAACTPRETKDENETNSRIIGLYGAARMIKFLEKYLIDKREMKKSFLIEEIKQLCKDNGPWAIHFVAQRLCDPRFEHDPTRANNMGKLILAWFDDFKKDSKRRAEEAKREEMKTMKQATQQPQPLPAPIEQVRQETITVAQPIVQTTALVPVEVQTPAPIIQTQTISNNAPEGTLKVNLLEKPTEPMIMAPPPVASSTI
ncbi:MAG: hypothetical protein PHN45_05010 [Methylococcales bacterium]|nr:hypothetical protein [Methylococcales bacterium]